MISGPWNLPVNHINSIVANTEKIMGSFFPFMETLGIGIVSLSLLITWLGRIALICPSKMGERFGLCSLDFCPGKETTPVFEDILKFELRIEVVRWCDGI